MIVEFLVRMLTGFARGILSLFPTDGPPDWFTTAGVQWSNLMDAAGGLSNWLPVALAVQVMGTVLACVVVGFGIKVARMLLSYFTAGGGAAG